MSSAFLKFSIPSLIAAVLTLILTSCTEKPSIDGSYKADFSGFSSASGMSSDFSRGVGNLIQMTLEIKEPKATVIAKVMNATQRDELALERTQSGFILSGKGANTGKPLAFKVVESGDLVCESCPSMSLPKNWRAINRSVTSK